MKKCIKCRVLRPNSRFRTRVMSRDGLRNTCLVCEKAYHAQWYQSNRAEKKEYNREYYDTYVKSSPTGE